MADSPESEDSPLLDAAGHTESLRGSKVKQLRARGIKIDGYKWPGPLDISVPAQV